MPQDGRLTVATGSIAAVERREFAQSLGSGFDDYIVDRDLDVGRAAVIDLLA